MTTLRGFLDVYSQGYQRERFFKSFERQVAESLDTLGKDSVKPKEFFAAAVSKSEGIHLHSVTRKTDKSNDEKYKMSSGLDPRERIQFESTRRNGHRTYYISDSNNGVNYAVDVSTIEVRPAPVISVQANGRIVLT